MGVGVHTGEVVAGNMGAEHRLNYTVIGDTVNVAARLESETKPVGRSPLFSQATLEAAGLTVAEVDTIGPLQVKGRKQPILVSTWKNP
jgi:adenylate cyclase